MKGLQIANLVAALFHLTLFCVIIGYWAEGDFKFISDVSISLGIQLDVSTVPGVVQFEPYVAEAGQYDVGLAIPFFVLPTAISHVIQVIQHQKIIETKNNWYRWVEYGVTSGVMLNILGSLSALKDLNCFIDTFLLMFLCNLTGLVAEYYRRQRWESLSVKNSGETKGLLNKSFYKSIGKKSDEASHSKVIPPENIFIAAGFILLLIAYKTIAIPFFIAIQHAIDGLPWWVYLAFFGLFFFYSLFGVVFLIHYTNGPREWGEKYEKYEWAYLVLSFLSKGLLALITFTSVIGRAS